MFCQSEDYLEIEREDGNDVFYPWSRDSKGYVVGKDERELFNRSISKVWLCATLVAIGLSAIIDGPVGFTLSFGTIFVTCLFYGLRVRKLVEGRPVLPPIEKARFNAEFNQMYTRRELVMLSLPCFLFAAAGLWIFVADSYSNDNYLGLALAAFFGLLSFVLARRANLWRPPVG